MRQQLQVELKNAPTDVVLVCSSANLGLNKLQRVSDQGKVLACNNLEGHLPERIRGLKDILCVYFTNNGGAGKTSSNYNKIR